MTMKSKLLGMAGLGALIASSEASAAAAAPAAPEGGTPPEPNASGAGNTPAGLTAEQETEIVDTLKETSAASELKGFNDANARVATVFASDAAIANPKLAAFLLTETNASADKVIDQLNAQAPAAAAPAATVVEPAAGAAVTQPTVASMAAATPAASRAPTGEEQDEETDVKSVFQGIDWSNKSNIVEDRGNALRVN